MKMRPDALTSGMVRLIDTMDMKHRQQLRDAGLLRLPLSPGAHRMKAQRLSIGLADPLEDPSFVLCGGLREEHG